MSEIEDKLLNCRDCHGTFVFTAGEQEFFAVRGLANEPKRCANCRLLLRMQRSGKDISTVAEVNCHTCGALTKVPFQPRGYSPVYCTLCYALKRPPRQSQECVI